MRPSSMTSTWGALHAYAADIYRNRQFCMSLTVNDIKRKYRRSALGIAWAMVQPVLLAMVLCFVFRHAFQVGQRGYFTYILSGLCFWNFMTHVVAVGCGSIRGAEPYILQHRVPMAIYTLRFSLVGAFHFAMPMIPVLVLSIAHRGVPSWAPMLSMIGAVVLLLFFGWALASIFGLASVYFPDLQHLSHVSLNILFYATPILWRAEVLRARSLGWLVDANPLASFLQMLRDPILEGRCPPAHAVLLVCGTVTATMLVAVLLFARFERRLVFRF